MFGLSEISSSLIGCKLDWGNAKKVPKKFRFHASEKGELAKLQVITWNPPRFTCCPSIPFPYGPFGKEIFEDFFLSAKKKDLWPLDVVATRHLKEICMECDALAIACGISSHLVLRFLSSWFPWLKTGAFNEVVRCPGHRELFGDFLPRNWDKKITTKVSWTQNFKLG